MDGLDHHNGVVDYNGDCEHECRQGDEVEREAYELKYEEGTHKCHRNGDGRDESGAEVVQEQINYKEYQNKGLDKGVYHILD